MCAEFPGISLPIMYISSSGGRGHLREVVGYKELQI